MFCKGQEINNNDESEDCKKIQNYIFKLNDKIGKGNFSEVFHGIDCNTGQKIAVKVIKYSSIKSRVAEQLLKNQVSILKELDHQNVLKCIDIFSSKNNCYIITQFLEGGDLEHYLEKYRILQEDHISRIVYQVYKGLLYLNEKGIVHRDFKIANIFLDSNGNAKIADFGFAIKTTQPFKDINIGSPIYMSPEGMILHEYGPKTEVWAFGIMIYELLHGQTPLSSCRSEAELREKIMLPPRFRQGISPECKSFIDMCLTVDHKFRIDLKDFHKTPYFIRLKSENQGIRMGNMVTSARMKFVKEDLSTHHSMNSLIMVDGVQQLISSITSYKEGLAIVQYCRLIHKTVKIVSSSILSQWLLNICSKLRNIQLKGGDRTHNEKLIQTIHSYFKKYRKEHAPMHELTGHPMINEVLYQLTQLKKKYPDHSCQSHISFLLKQTQLLNKSIQIPSFIFSKYSQAQHFINSNKQKPKQFQMGRTLFCG